MLTPGKKPTKRPGRTRRRAGWSLLVVGVLITSVWVTSRWWAFGYLGASWRHGANNGNWYTSFDAPATSQPTGWYFRAIDPVFESWNWWIRVDQSTTGGPFKKVVGYNLIFVEYAEWSAAANGGPLMRFVRVIPWPFALASLLGGGWLAWSGRRARRHAMTGVCLKCGYDLAGLAAGSPCPECGEPTPVR